MSTAATIALIVALITAACVAAIVRVLLAPTHKDPDQSRLDRLDKPRWPGVIETERRAQEAEWAELDDNSTKGTS